MSEIIVNSLSNRFIICNTERNNRKYEFSLEENNYNDKEYDENCPLCFGNESMTPTETFSIIKNNKWLVRSVPNKYPILSRNYKNRTIEKGFYGEHEVLIESNQHNKNYYNINKEDFTNILNMYLERYNALNKKDNKYISIIKNHLKASGASLEHSHSQIISIPIIPPVIANEIKNSKYYLLEKNISYFNDMKRHEKNIFLNSEYFYAFVPDDSEFSLEVNIVSKNKSRFEKINNKEIEYLSDILFQCFNKLKNVTGCLPFNMYLHTLPTCFNGDYKYYKYHFHIIQRKWVFGGFELSNGIYVNSIDSNKLSGKLKKN